ncbi:MAG: IS4 family transposase [Deltaproteobacteria bacterium]|nr:IS4 family transposase [Deltaproteobacteria bacterium]
MAHYNTVLHQMLQFVPRWEFEKLVKKYQGNHRVRNFSCWALFVCHLYAQLARQVSLRDLETTIRSKLRKFIHLGISHFSRSTMAEANERRSYRIYEELFYMMYQRCQRIAPDHKFSFKHKLYTLDATTVDLCLSVFRWAKFRKTKGALKIHTLLDHRGHIPRCIIVTDGKTHEIQAARKLRLEPDSILIIDRAYIDYCWLYQIHLQDAWFVTRLKSNMRYRVKKRLPADRALGITSDQIIQITGTKAHCIPILLRRVRFVNPEDGHAYVFLTNIMHLSARQIADIYKARWKVEIFFKWIKEHLKIKSFLGTSKNAVLIQIFIALCTYLLLAFLRFIYMSPFGMYELKKRLEVNLLERTSLQELLVPPENTKNSDLEARQLCFAAFF